MRTILNLTLFMTLIMGGGCATIMRGTHQNVEFATNPPGATLQIAGKTLNTPTVVKLQRAKSYPVTVSKPGYDTIRFDLNPIWDGISLVGNMILPGGSLGLVLDAGDGADHCFTEMAEISMVPSTQPDDPPLVLNCYKGHLLTDGQLAVAIRADRLDRSQFFRGEP